jgi:hypothetical protein
MVEYMLIQFEPTSARLINFTLNRIGVISTSLIQRLVPLFVISRLSSCPARKCFVLVIWSCPVLVGAGGIVYFSPELLLMMAISKYIVSE